MGAVNKYTIEQFVENGKKDLPQERLAEMAKFAEDNLARLRSEPDTWTDHFGNEHPKDTEFQKLLEDFLKEYNQIISETQTETGALREEQTPQGVQNQTQTPQRTRERANWENRTNLEELQGNGYTVQRGDWLSIITKGLNIKFNSEANKIWPGDIITLKGNKLIRNHNGTEAEVGVWRDYVEPTTTVSPAQEPETTEAPVAPTTPRSTPDRVPSETGEGNGNGANNGESTNPPIDPERVEVSTETILLNINEQFNAFKDTISKINTITDTQTSSERALNTDLLEINYNALIILLEQYRENLSPEVINKTNEVKLYLARYYADEGEVENSNFTNYNLSNNLAFDVLGNIEGVNPPPKAPDMQDILGSFKGTGVGTYIVTKINEGEEISNIFNSEIVKEATEEEGEELTDKYEDDLEEYLENIDDEHRSKLSDIQKEALDLLMDVNGAGWSVSNSTTDMINIFGWDFAAIGAGMYTGALAGSIAGAWTGPGTLLTGSIGAVIGGATATIGMMYNHGDNYFSEDWEKGLTEFGINTATFGLFRAAFKGARYVETTKGLRYALPAEMTADVAIGTMADLTRSWAYNLNIEVSDAVVNNLVWALLPVALNGRQIFSEARTSLAKEASDIQQRAGILSRLGDTTGAKRLIEGLNSKIQELKSKSEEIYTYRGREYIKQSDGGFVNKATGNPYTGNVSNLRKVETNNRRAETTSARRVEFNKVFENISAIGKNIYGKIHNKLSVSGKAKLEAKGGEQGFIKDFKENLWKKIEADYEGWRFITGTIKAPFRVGVFGIQQGGTHFLKPAWEVTSALNPIKMHNSLNWKQKVIGGLTASTIYEGLTLGDNESIFDPEHLANIPVNGIQLATVGFWTILSEPLVNTLYGQFKGFEQRDFIPSYFDNIYGNINGGEIPYELGESLVTHDREILLRLIRAYEQAGYPEQIISPLREKLNSLSETTE